MQVAFPPGEVWLVGQAEHELLAKPKLTKHPVQVMLLLFDVQVAQPVGQEMQGAFPPGEVWLL